MAMKPQLGKKQIGTALRKKGYSYEEISTKLRVAKSSAYLWTSTVLLNEKAKARLERRKIEGRLRSIRTRKINLKMARKELTNKLKVMLKGLVFSSAIKKVICSIFIWTEGGELTGRYVSLMNSNPLMIQTFLKLFRESFVLDEKKFRGLIHLHEYHDEITIRKFWSQISNIPLAQFNISYMKPHTGKVKREGYKGCIRISYYDAKIALELRMLYNIFAKIMVKGRSSTAE